MAKPVFELKNVSFSYLGRFPALEGIGLEVEEGSRVAVIGANGTGKSTLLAMLDALIFPEKGTIRAFDTELREDAFSDGEFSRAFRKKVGFVFQNPEVQLFCPTVKEDIAFGPLQLGVPQDEVKRRLDKLAEELGISRLLERSPHQLSIGEKKKAAIASVLAIEPEVLLLDEPTAGLDPKTTRDIVDIILGQNGSDSTVVIATHDMHIVKDIADIVHVLGAERKIVRSGEPSVILGDRKFLEENNLVHVHKHLHDGKEHAHPHLHLDHHPEHHGG